MTMTSSGLSFDLVLLGELLFNLGESGVSLSRGELGDFGNVGSCSTVSCKDSLGFFNSLSI